MNDILWDKLQPYGGDSKKSFEELCFQIVLEVFKDDITSGAVVTSIDDSGGGDGVEFYITYENGDVYGWQAKFFCRLNEGGRKEQIKKSLQTAYKKHPNLKKWFLCSQCNFTPDEKEWFDNSLENSIKDTERVLPENHNVELIHWGESQLLNYLKDYPSIHKFFFSTKLLTQNWFEDRYNIDIQKTQIKAKYESEIHIPTNIDKTIHRILGGNRLAEVLDQEMELNQVKIYEKEYKDACSKVFSENIQEEYIYIQAEFRKFLQDKDNIIEIGIYKLLKIRETILAQDEENLKNQIKTLEEYIISLKTFFHEYGMTPIL